MEDLKNLKKLKSIDLKDFNGVKSKIESVEMTDIEEKDFGEGAQVVRQVKVSTNVLNDDKDKPIRAIEYIPLKREGEEWGYSDNPKSKAMKMLSFFDIKSFDELIGKEVVVIMKQRESGKEYLGMNFG